MALIEPCCVKKMCNNPASNKSLEIMCFLWPKSCNSIQIVFAAGDTFEKLEDEDEQGWCKGRKDGKVGLYPANYIEVI